MDKKSIIGLVLIFAIFVGYMFWIAPSKEEMAERQRVYDSTLQAQLAEQRAADSLAAIEKQQLAAGDSNAASISKGDSIRAAARTITIDNGLLNIEVNTLGAQVNRVVLNQYSTYDSLPLQLITPAEDNMNLVFYTEDNRTVNTRDLLFTAQIEGREALAEADVPEDLAVKEGDSIVLLLTTPIVADSQHEAQLAMRYTLRGNSYDVGFEVELAGAQGVVRQSGYMDLIWKNRMQRQEKVNSGSRGKANRNSDRERYYTDIYYKTPKDKKVDNLRLGQDKAKQVKTPVEWVAFKQQFFAAIINAESGVPFENADLEVRTNQRDTALHYLTNMEAQIGLPYDAQHTRWALNFYYGPTKYRDLRAMHRGYDKMLPLGWTIISKSISRWLIIPVFNLLEKFNWNYGIIIIIFTLLFRLVMLPLMYKSYEGGAIMRILKPEMDALNKKFPNPDQAMAKQQQMMALQRRAGYNPMAGCLPVLLQMPVWTAMFLGRRVSFGATTSPTSIRYSTLASTYRSTATTSRSSAC